MESVNDLLQDESIRHQVALQGYSTGVVQRIMAVLNRSDARLAAELAQLLESMSPTTFKMERLESLLSSVRSLSTAAYDQMGKALSDELREFVAYEVSYQHQMLVSHVPVAVHVAAVSAESVYAAALARPFQGVLLKNVWSDLEAQKFKKVRQSIAQGYVEGKTTDQIIRELRGTRAKGYEDGLIQRDRRDVEAVVRTALGHTAGMAQDRVMEANTDLLKALQWSSTLDLRTSAPCRIRDRLLYAPGDHKPIGHKVPWLAGPGRLHWRAVVAGTPVLTGSGWVPIEEICTGDLVLTHRGRWMPVLATRSKRCDSGVVRVVHTQSGRELRATDDHPVLTSSGGWKFIGALEVGDKLFSNAEGLGEVFRMNCKIGAETKDGPTLRDESHVALSRTIKLVASNIDLEGELDVDPGEIDDRCAKWVLGNPSIIKGDECLQHHLLALAQMLLECGCNALGEVLSGFERHWLPGHPGRGLGERSAGDIGRAHARGGLGVVDRVSFSHQPGVHGVLGGRLLGQAVSPVLFARPALDASRVKVNQSLLGFRANRDSMLLGKVGQTSVGKAELALDASKRLSLVDVMLLDDAAMVDHGFVHDEVLTLEVQECNELVYDLEVAEDASYLASGVVVSNCRSGQVPVLKSHKELGIDIPEIVVDGQTRASLDGQVPRDTTYAAWIQKQSAARQDEVLGPTRGKLLRQGKLEMAEMYTARGELLTLDDLRKRDAEAFKLAGL